MKMCKAAVDLRLCAFMEVKMSKPRLAVASSSLPDEAKKHLEELCETVYLPPDKLLSEPVSTHPDMIFANVGKSLFFHTTYYEENRATVERIAKLTGFEIVLSSCERGDKYPLDVAFNCFVLEDRLFCRRDSTAQEILRGGIETVNVKQGYTACSTLVGDGFLITADRSVYNASKDAFSALLIREGGVELPPYNTGFIGGASGFFENTVYTVGEMETHPDFNMIKTFLKEKNTDLVALMKGHLQDFGGIKFF